MAKPKIRFNGYTEDWEQRKWIDTVDISTEMVDPTSGEYDNMPHIAPGNIESFTGRILDNVKAVKEEKLISGKFRFRPGDVVYGKINPQLGKYFYASVDGLTSADAYVFNGKNGLTQKFLFSLLQTNDFFKYSVSVSKRSGMPKINRDELNAYSFLTPSEAEQEKIGGLILGIDHLITLHQRKCEQTKTLKKYMLQKMFPQDGEKVPQIRFEGFTEDWEQRKLGEVVKEGILEAPLDGNHGEKHPTSDEYVESGIPFLMASDIHNGEVNIYSCKYITKERAERLDKGFARNGDVLLTHKATIGETAILSNLMTEYAMLTPQVTYYRIKNEERLNREYLYSFFNSLDFQTELKTKAAQSTRPYIGITAQQNLKIILPSEIDEQRKIGLYFGNLDRLITLHQRKCDELKEVKKFMLQNMFV
ncbi:restriction endonuclease subunit S [Dorea sp. AF24-7LB]|uniref:restriction endonuclease subunit S n=1 Tax=Dorea sp. AF24-7LB TaxID=2293097 RepID=UPI001314CCE3|nr:restriction endonuclease subunit S [Dorea sp. AF24-7LB]